MEVKEIDVLGERIELKRIIGSIKGSKNSPTIIAIGGMHGNERAGVVALQKVFKRVVEENIKFKGNFYALTGNIEALKKNVRYNSLDLNRIWIENDFEKIRLNAQDIPEYKELIEIYDVIKKIVSKEKGPFIFLDLHTTSSDSKPFITISDSLNNRKYSKNFPVPIILGIEEHLEGPFLSFINKFGHISLGFEGGQHDDPKSVVNCEAFLYIALTASKCIKKTAIKNLAAYENTFLETHKKSEFVEINYRYAIGSDDRFQMLKGFKNFDEIFTNQMLAYNNGKAIKAPYHGEILMPLYQEKGEDGFFIVRSISGFWLFLSRFVRLLNIHFFLRMLPGIKKHQTLSNTLVVNPKIAAFFTTDFFHLFGYRKKVMKHDQWLFTKRDRKFRKLN